MPRLSAFICAAVVFSTCLPVAADEIDYVVDSTFPGGTDTSSAEVFLPQFDPSLGTLQSLSITVSASPTGSVTLTNTLTCGDCRETDGADPAFDLEGSDPFGGSISLVVSAGDYSADLDPGQTSAPQPWTTGAISGPFEIAGSALPYIGTGTVTIDFTADVYVPFFHQSHNTLVGLSLDDSPVTVDVAYDYAPSVPEPGTGWLMAGFCAFTVLRSLYKGHRIRSA